MAYDFPANPALDDVYETPNGDTYTFNGEVWLMGSGTLRSIGVALAAKVNVFGDTMTGHLFLADKPEMGQHAAHKAYVDTKVEEAPFDGKIYARKEEAWTEVMPPAPVIVGDAVPANPLTGQLWWDSDSGDLNIYFQDPDSAQWVQVNASGDFVKRSGDIMSGPLSLPIAAPTLGEHATNKAYVDTSIANQSLYQGAWQVATNVPDLAVAVAAPLNGYSWTAVTADPMVPEVALAALPGIGGATVYSGDTIKYNEPLAIYEHIKVASTSGGVPEAPADGVQYARQDAAWAAIPPVTGFLPLAGGTLTGNLHLPEGGSFDWNNAAGAPRWSWIGSDTSLSLVNQGRNFPIDIAQSTGVVDFCATPTVNGGPMVLLGQHQAALDRITQLEARLAKLEGAR